MRGVTCPPINLSRTFGFQLTRLMRGVTFCMCKCETEKYISTHTPHARRDLLPVLQTLCSMISTHTPHARRDTVGEHKHTQPVISTHTPHARRDTRNSPSCLDCKGFQLTRLMRGVTSLEPSFALFEVFQLTRLMRGVTYYADFVYYDLEISTHTPHARRDPSFITVVLSVSYISTHTPHARRDFTPDRKRC